MRREVTRTTLALPTELIRALDSAVERGKAHSRSELLARAAERELRAMERSEIDEAFAGMSDDSDYQAEAEEIAASFEMSSWEALQAVEAR